VIKIKNAAKNGNVKIRNSAIAEPELVLFINLTINIFIYCN
jgi:hypothetical protein